MCSTTVMIYGFIFIQCSACGVATSECKMNSILISRSFFVSYTDPMRSSDALTTGMPFPRVVAAF